MSNNRHAHKLLLLLILLLPCTAVAQEFATDLNGFRLWQYKDTAQTYFGKPFQTQKNDEYSIEAYQVTDSSYMVIEHWEKYPDNIFSIQITRYPTRMLPFKGLVLGDPARKVQEALGKPSRTKKLEKPPVTVNYYDKTNYSTEIDADGRLYSIKIHVTNEFMNDADDDFDQWTAFKKAVLAKDIKAVLELVRPDVLRAQLDSAPEESLVVGDTGSFPEGLLRGLHRVKVGKPRYPYAVALAEAARGKYERDDFPPPSEIRPMYLREPDVTINWAKLRSEGPWGAV